jgi:hypothetical protein
MAQAMAQQAGENGVDMAQLFSANQANTMPV